MVLIRPFEERDNTAMLDIDKFCTQGNETLAILEMLFCDLCNKYQAP